ncbi:hypothetical protein [Azospirillum endophyticum]
MNTAKAPICKGLPPCRTGGCRQSRTLAGQSNRTACNICRRIRELVIWHKGCLPAFEECVHRKQSVGRPACGRGR